MGFRGYYCCLFRSHEYPMKISPKFFPRASTERVRSCQKMHPNHIQFFSPIWVILIHIPQEVWGKNQGSFKASSTGIFLEFPGFPLSQWIGLGTTKITGTPILLLVGGAITILKNDGVRQLGRMTSHNMKWHKKTSSKPPTWLSI